jgi:hypothetical protein
METPARVKADPDKHQHNGEPVKRKNAKDATYVKPLPIGRSLRLQQLGVEQIPRNHEENGDAKLAGKGVEAVGVTCPRKTQPRKTGVLS